MQIPGVLFRDLHLALVDAYDRESIDQMALFGLGLRLDTIVGNVGMNSVVYELMVWAESRGRLRELWRAAVDERPANSALARVVASLEVSAAETALPDRRWGLGGIPSLVSGAVRTFVARSHHDRAGCEELIKHLTPLRRNGSITLVDGGALEEADEATLRHLDESQVVLLLVSASLLASEACWEISARRAMALREKGTRVIPVFLSHADWSDAPFGALKGLPTRDGPIAAWPNRDTAFAHVVEELRAVFNAIRAKG